VNLTHVLRTQPERLFNWIAQSGNERDGDYCRLWQKLQDNVYALSKTFFNVVEYSDLGIIHHIVSAVPENSLLFVGNSSIARYIGFFQPGSKSIFSNRGTSGIDAVGIAYASHETVFALVGDQSFVYDSNALWNRTLPENLKIIVINNQGGGIFSLIDGPSTTPVFRPYLEAHHPADICKLSGAYGVNYYRCENFGDFNNSFETFIRAEGTAVYEVITPKEVNPIVFRNFISQLKRSV
jgi:2-succinyl-5-enolpyruvyl-6-hydroxy-3-cyclohexene-1-carboxylate synthase